MTASLPGGGELVLDSHRERGQAPDIVREVFWDTRRFRPPERPSRGGRGQRKSPQMRALLQWRDPDSNRGHHDFQAPDLSRHMATKYLQISGNDRESRI